MNMLDRAALAAALAFAGLMAGCGGEDTVAVDPPPLPANPATPGTASRPQLSDSEAQAFVPGAYFEKAGALGTDGSTLTLDPWTPPAVGDVASFTPTFVVAADGSGTHTGLQAAFDAVPAAGAGVARTYILVKPGTYRGVACANGKGPITLYGAGPDAAAVVFVAGHYNGEAKAAGVPANPCNPNAAGLTYGTSGSATVAVYSNEFHARNITFANDATKAVVHGAGYPAGASGNSGAQAVALMTQGDKLVFENVRVSSHQDSLYVKTANAGTVSRAFFLDSLVEGDVDFVFGRGTAVFQNCEIRYLSTRLPVGASTAMVAPSTAPRQAFGFLFVRSRFTADAGAVPGTIFLGRAWDEGVNSTTNPYVAGTSPNGQLLVRDSTIGAHVKTDAPWTTSTSGRVWTAEGNRFAEHRNAVLKP